MSTEPESTVPTTFFEYMIAIMAQNEAFLKEQAGGTNAEVIELVNDAINGLGLIPKAGATPTESGSWCITYFFSHILMPFSYGIHTDLRTGNLPVCFMQLRTIVEAFGKCQLADSKYPNHPLFDERLALLEQKERNISRLMRQVDKLLGSGDQLYQLWQDLSQHWVHTAGLSNRMVGHMLAQPGVPAWSLALPMDYGHEDLPVITELGRYVTDFRSLLKPIIRRADMPK